MTNRNHTLTNNQVTHNTAAPPQHLTLQRKPQKEPQTKQPQTEIQTQTHSTSRSISSSQNQLSFDALKPNLSAHFQPSSDPNLHHLTIPAATTISTTSEHNKNDNNASITFFESSFSSVEKYSSSPSSSSSSSYSLSPTQHKTHLHIHNPLRNHSPSMVSYFDEASTQQLGDSTLSSTDSTTSAQTSHSFLSVTSTSSASSSSSSCYQYQYSPTATLNSSKQQLNQQHMNKYQSTTFNPQSQTTDSANSNRDLSFSYSSSRVDPDYLGQTSYNCYKPTTTTMYSHRQSTSVTSSAGATKPPYPTTGYYSSHQQQQYQAGHSTSSSSTYDNSQILNHHQQFLNPPLHQINAYNPSNNVLSSLSQDLTKNTFYKTQPTRTPAANTYRTPSKQHLFDISDNEEDEPLHYGHPQYTSPATYTPKSSWRAGTKNDTRKSDRFSREEADTSNVVASMGSLAISSAASSASMVNPVEPDLTSDSGRLDAFEQVQIRFLVYCTSLSKLHVAFAKRICHSQTALSVYHDVASQAMAKDPRFQYDSIEKSAIKLCDVLRNSPSDQLTSDVYVFTVKISAMQGRHEVYVPKLLFILESLHDEGTIDDEIFLRVFTIYILHLLHFKNESIEVFDILGKYFLSDDPVWNLVRAWIEKDYLHWRRLYDSEPDVARKRVMKFGELTMAREALERRIKTSPPVSEDEMVAMMGAQWETLLGDLKCNWTRDESGRIVVK